MQDEHLVDFSRKPQVAPLPFSSISQLVAARRTDSFSDNGGNDCDDTSNGNAKSIRKRPLLILLFALILASMAKSLPAQDVATIQYDGATNIRLDPHHVSGGAAIAAPNQRRPAYVEMSAALANFDADADPDGWRAAVVVRDRNDQPVTMRATATFELKPRLWSITEDKRIGHQAESIKWTQQLVFNDEGIAEVKLPLRKSLRSLLGWREDSRAMRTTLFGSSNFQSTRKRRSFATADVRQVIGTPRYGHLSVRVAIPTEGVFESVSTVEIRPSVLVDTQWPSR